MKKLFRHIQWLISGRKVFTLVGRSGTGKSFRSKLLAEKYGIELIIDDGLLIRGDTIVAGHSAKREDSYLSAIRTAIFDDPDDRYTMIQAIAKQHFKRILILGTSEKMVFRIISRLYLPKPHRMFQIEDVSTPEEIAMAIRARTVEGKHVIPVAQAEISREHPHIVYDSIKVFLHKSIPWKQKGFEKTEVQPLFHVGEKLTPKDVSTSSIQSVVEESLSYFDPAYEIKRIVLKPLHPGYALLLKLRIPEEISFGKNVGTLKNFLIQDLEKRDIMLKEVDIQVME